LEAGAIGTNTPNTSNTSGITFVAVATNIFDSTHSSHEKLDESFLKNQYSEKQKNESGAIYPVTP
jgi:hypothetical protein